MTEHLRRLLPKVLAETGLKSEASLNAKIGSKADDFIDLKNEVINSPEHYASLYLDGFQKTLTLRAPNSYNSINEIYDLFQSSQVAQQYMMIFLERSYLKHYDELSKQRPPDEDAEIWIGQNAADYGLLVAPRFANGDWENDKSEIRHFKPGYWTIGHVLETGLVVPRKQKRMTFKDVENYLDFFEEVLVRHAKSKHQSGLAERYSAYVRAAANPLQVPLLIPELRYEGRAQKHRYRLDFCVIDTATLQKTGFELSPWSSHGELTGTKGKSQKEINAEASANFDEEMKKHKSYYRRHGIFALIYTDADLENMDSVFEDVKDCLEVKTVMTQVNFHLIASFFR
jgi:hypothetical protein